MFDRREGDALEKIIALCIKYSYITIDSLNNQNYISNYITKYIRELIIKVFLINSEDIQILYEQLVDKKSIFNVWKLDLDNEVRTKLEPEIRNLFLSDFLEYKKLITKISR